MEKQKKQFAVLLAVLVVMILVYLGIRFYNQKAEEKETAEEEAETVTVTDFDTDDVTAFSYQLNGETLSFTKDGDNWFYDGDVTLDLDESVVTTMLSAASNLTTTDVLDEYDSLADYGLDAPENTITITTSDGVITLMVGSSNEITGDYYMMTGDSDTVYLISSSLSSSFGKTVEELIAEEEETEATEEVETTEEVEMTEEAEVTEAD